MIKSMTSRDIGYSDALLVRKEVFVREQEIDESLEIDDQEDSSLHFVYYDNDEPVGAGRLREVNGDGKVERVSVLSSHRKKGIGEKLMKAMEEVAIERSLVSLILYAQTHAEDFYKKLGFKTTSKEPFLDAGIPHVGMKKVLKTSS